MPIYSRSGNFEIIERGDPPHIGFHFWSLHAPWTKSACNMPLHLGCGVKSVSYGMFILKIKTSIRNAHGIDVASEVCKQTMHFCKLTFVTPTNFVVLETQCFAQNQNLLRVSLSWTNGANFGEQGRSAHVCCPNTREHEFDRFFKVLLCPSLQLKRFQSSLNQFDSASPECDKIANLKCFQINFVNFDQSFSTVESILTDLIFLLPPPPDMNQFKSTWIFLSQLWLICKCSGTCVMAKPLQRIHCKRNWNNNAQLCDMTISWHQNRQITTLIQLLYPNTRKPPFWSNFCDVMTFWWFLTQKNQKKAILAKGRFFVVEVSRELVEISRDSRDASRD